MQKRRFLSLVCAAPDDLAALALWCQVFTPLTAPDPPDGVMLDITGCAHLFGGEAGLMARLAARLPDPRIAIADYAAAAWSLARYGQAPALRLAQALGEAPEPIRFITAPPEWREMEPFMELSPVSAHET